MLFAAVVGNGTFHRTAKRHRGVFGGGKRAGRGTRLPRYASYFGRMRHRTGGGLGKIPPFGGRFLVAFRRSGLRRKKRRDTPYARNASKQRPGAHALRKIRLSTVFCSEKFLYKPDRRRHFNEI